jgi:hypothetical protein
MLLRGQEVQFRNGDPDVLLGSGIFSETLSCFFREQMFRKGEYVGCEHDPDVLNAIAEMIRSAAGTQEGSPATPEADQTLTGEARALMFLVGHPGWTDQQIADAVPCSRTTLYDWPLYKAAREALKTGKGETPHGAKHGKTHQAEAWADRLPPTSPQADHLAQKQRHDDEDEGAGE